MRSFLGVPIVAPDEGVIGAFYLTEKETGPSFDAHDQELIELLAAHAAIAITNARLYERSRELLDPVRTPLALELHDVVSQKLFSLNLAAEAAATLLDRGPEQARPQLERVRELARKSSPLRSLIFGLRPAELARDGLEGVLRKEATMLQHASTAYRSRVDADGAPPDVEPACAGEILRIVEEALHNAVRHAQAQTVSVHLHGSDFTPARRGLR